MTIAGLPEEELFASGHRACAGCGAALALRIITKAAGKNSVICESTGCMEVVSTPYPETSWRIPWIHGAFENNSSIASGVEAALKVLKKDDVKVIALGGDGASYDIGIRGTSGAFERGHNFTYICYDNEAYMNTGIQRSGATPFAASTTTSPAGKAILGKTERKKDLLHILVAHGSPYAASCSVGYPQDAYKKIKKAIETRGPTFINIYAPCVPGWRYDPSQSITLAKLGVQTGATPIYEVIEGKHKVTMPRDPQSLKPIEDYLKLQGRFRHLFKPEPKKEQIESIQKDVKDSLQRLIELEEKGF
ncbi:MAG: thiamine pyrophosphate-dependent enzyme [Candidatus Altiarchaeota archaeon]